MSPGRWVCTAALRGERRCQQPPVAGALAPLPPATDSTGARRGARMPREPPWSAQSPGRASGINSHGSARSHQCHSPVFCCAGGTRNHGRAGVWSWVVNTTLTVGWDVPPCLCQPSGGQGLRGRGAPTLAMRWLRSGRAASHPQQLFQFPFWLSGGVGPIPHRALPPHGTPCTHLCAPPQPALGEKGTQAAPAAAKPPPTENTGAKASSQHGVPPHSPP